MTLTPHGYLRARCKAAKARLAEFFISDKPNLPAFQETKNSLYNYLQGMRDMAYYLGQLDEEENYLWLNHILQLYYSQSPEEIEALMDHPPGLFDKESEFGANFKDKVTSPQQDSPIKT